MNTVIRSLVYLVNEFRLSVHVEKKDDQINSETYCKY